MSKRGRARTEDLPPARTDPLRAVLLLWALAVTVIFFLQPSTSDVLLSFALTLLGGGR